METKHDGAPAKPGSQNLNDLHQSEKSKEQARKESIPSPDKERHPEDQSNASRNNRHRGSGEGEIGMDRGAGHPTGR